MGADTEDDWRAVEPALARRLLELSVALEEHIRGGPFLMMEREAFPIIDALDAAAAELERRADGRPRREAPRRRDLPGQRR